MAEGIIQNFFGTSNHELGHMLHQLEQRIHERLDAQSALLNVIGFKIDRLEKIMGQNQQAVDQALARVQADSSKILGSVGTISSYISDLAQKNAQTVADLQARLDADEAALKDAGVDTAALQSGLDELDSNTGKLADLASSLTSAAQAPGTGGSTPGTPTTPATPAPGGNGNPIVPEDGQPTDSGVVANHPDNERDPITGLPPGVTPDPTTPGPGATQPVQGSVPEDTSVPTPAVPAEDNTRTP
jgi:hypothetical protein